MARKMAILKYAALSFMAVAFIGACRIAQPYYPAGGPGKLNVSGIYDTKVEFYSTSCSGATPPIERRRTHVEHTPGALIFKLTINEQPFDGRIQPNGSFTIQATTREAQTNIDGRFTDSSFYARVNVKLIARTSPRTVTPTVAAGPCEYQLRWSGIKL